MADIERDLITATAAISGFASCLFGLFTNLPVALAYGESRLVSFGTYTNGLLEIDLEWG
jgi:xanthine/uracil/vitamin C permease (AzgA family)